MHLKIRYRATIALIAIAMAVSLPVGPHAAAVAATKDRCEGSGIPIWITVEQVRSGRGTIKVTLYANNRENFLKKGRKIARTRVVARQGETRLCLDAPSPGKYSIALYHDENDNKKFDRNFLGIPEEGFGFSNNPSLGLGPPDQVETLFDVGPKPTTVKLSVNYLWD